MTVVALSDHFSHHHLPHHHQQLSLPREQEHQPQQQQQPPPTPAAALAATAAAALALLLPTKNHHHQLQQQLQDLGCTTPPWPSPVPTERPQMAPNDGEPLHLTAETKPLNTPQPGPFEALLLRHLAKSGGSTPSLVFDYRSGSSPVDSTPPDSNASLSPLPSPLPVAYPNPSPPPPSVAEDCHRIGVKEELSYHPTTRDLPQPPPPPTESATPFPSSPTGLVDQSSLPPPQQPPQPPPPSPSLSNSDLSPQSSPCVSPRSSLKPPQIRTDPATIKRPVSLAVGFTIGSPTDEDEGEPSGDESFADAVAADPKAGRLSFNGHQKDHLAALHRLARSNPASVASSPNASPQAHQQNGELLTASSVTGSSLQTKLFLDAREPEAPYTGPLLSSFAAKNAITVASTPNSDLAATIADRRSGQKAMIVNELLETERMYVHDLRTLVESFFDRLNAVSWVPSDKKFSLMRNASELYRFQQEFLTNLEQAIDTARNNDEDDVARSVARVFVDMQQRFKVYSQYCIQHDGAIKILSEYESRPEMITFLKDFRGLAQTKLDVKDYLIKPVQRLCRYPLLISELVKHTPVNSAVYENLVEAHLVMQNVALEIDSAKWRMDNLERTDRFFERLEPAPSPANDLPRRLDVGDFILAGALHVINTDQYPFKLRYRGVFLFPEYIYVVKPRRMTQYTLKLCLSLSACEFRPLNHGESPLPNAWRIVDTEGGQTYDFCAQSEKERLAWTDMLSRLAVPARAVPPVWNTTPSGSSFLPTAPSSTTHSVTDFLDSLRRSSSVGSMSAMAKQQQQDAVANGSCNPPLRERTASTHGFQKKKFWRQSSADVRFDVFSPSPDCSQPGSGTSTLGSVTPTASVYHPVMNLARRASVDLRMLDVRTPLIPDVSTSTSGCVTSSKRNTQQIVDTSLGIELPTQKSVPDLNGLHRDRLLMMPINDALALANYPIPDSLPIFDKKSIQHVTSTGKNGPTIITTRAKPIRTWSESESGTLRRLSQSIKNFHHSDRGDSPPPDPAPRVPPPHVAEHSQHRNPSKHRPRHYRTSSLSSTSTCGSSHQIPHHYPSRHQEHQHHSGASSTSSVSTTPRRIASSASVNSYSIPPRTTSFTASAPLLNRYPSRSSLSSWVSDRCQSHPTIPSPPPPLPAPPIASQPLSSPLGSTTSLATDTSSSGGPLAHHDLALFRSSTCTSTMSTVTAPLPRTLMVSHSSSGTMPNRASMSPGDPRQYHDPRQFQRYTYSIHSEYNPQQLHQQCHGHQQSQNLQQPQKRQNVLRRTWSQIFHTGRQIKGALHRRKGTGNR
ncbi:hypothetical protein DFJ77DRAFT_129678 [Powellomyces hirtus]|nr:hypothetical protein DFJ77DRAFT_129678 [Powellomyces hirtus]